MKGKKTSIQISCDQGSWLYPPEFTNRRIECYPQCSKECLNGGWCYRPGMCKCKAGFTGTNCEFETNCLDFVPGVPFTKISYM